MSGDKVLIGAAGEHYVMSQLLQKGMIGALAPDGSPTIDILVSSVDGEPLASIQVKTRKSSGPARSWPMSAKHEVITDKRLFFCFVNLFTDQAKMPETFVVPNVVVAEAVKLDNQVWLSGKKRDGGDRKPTNLRTFSRNYTNLTKNNKIGYAAGWLDIYRENWDLLNPKAVGTPSI